MLKVHQTARLTLLLGSLLGAGGLAGACGSGLGDGVTDDGTTPPPLSGAGRNNVGQAGANNQAGAATSVAGTTASAASSGLGGSSGSGGTVGLGGSSGAVPNGGSTAGAPAGGSTGTAANGGGGTGGVSLFCGDGIIGGSEQCDDKAQTPLCSASCTLLATTDCIQCESGGGAVPICPSINNCIGTFDGDQQVQCDAILLCVNSSNCFDGTGTLDGSCYCGTLSLANCQAAPFDLTEPGAPNGPCATAIQAGFAGLSSNSDLLAHLLDPTQPAGAALARLTCQKTAQTGTCKTACGF